MWEEMDVDPVRKVAVLLLVLLLFMPCAELVKVGSQASSTRVYADFALGGLRVVVVDARSPSYVIRYMGVNYVDFDLSDDYSVRGVEGIPGFKHVGAAGNLSLDDLSMALESFRGVVPFYYSSLSGRMHPMAILHPELGAVEVVVSRDVNPVGVSKQIAVAVEPVLSSHGYRTLVVVRGFFNASLTRIGEAYDVFSSILMGLPDSNPPNDAPTYLREIIELQKKAFEKHQIMSYMSVSMGIYGTVGVDFWGPKPNKTEVYNLVKWLRDRAGPEYSDVPLYIIFHSEPPPQGNGLLITVANNSSKITRSPVYTGMTGSRVSHSIVILSSLTAAIVTVALLFSIKH